MAQHTPGPWHLATDTYGVRRVWTADEQSVGSCESDGGIDHEEETANGVLMAASPDLLEACKLIKDALGRLTLMYGDSETAADTQAECLHSLTAAIAKAEGRQ